MRLLWRGDVLPVDARTWARDRGERVVTYRRWRNVPTPDFTGIVVESHEDEMPESFFDNLHIADGWSYIEVSREDP